MSEGVDLIEIIKSNPGCIATIDNDCWWLHRAPPKPVEEMTEEEYDEWRDNGLLATDRTIKPMGGCGYVKDHLYGGAILIALAEIVGLQLEPV